MDAFFKEILLKWIKVLKRGSLNKSYLNNAHIHKGNFIGKAFSRKCFFI